MPRRTVQLRHGLRACQSALPRPRRAADDGAGYRTEGRRHVACLYPEQQSLAAAHDALHHRHRRGLVLECRLRTDLTHHELLRGYPPSGRQRAAPKADAYRDVSLIAMCLFFVLFILLFRALNSTSLINAIYTIASYTYGPLLGLFTFGLFTRRQPHDALVPLICIASPLLCYALDTATRHTTPLGLSLRLRTADAQWAPDLYRALALVAEEIRGYHYLC